MFNINSFFKGIFSIKRLSLIGAAIVSSKLVLILIAYFFNETEYNTFNKYYYTASILILFGSFGFNFAITRVKVKPLILFGSVTINLVFVLIIYVLLNETVLHFFDIISLFIYSLFSSVGSILVFKSLFDGNYGNYFILTLAHSLLHLSIIPLVKYLGFNLTILFPILGFIWIFIIVLLLFPLKENNSENVKRFYKLGFSAFVINSTAGLAFALDKYYINHFYQLEIANSYTFAWSLVAPIFYIGALIEKNIYSIKNGNAKKIIKKSAIWLIVAIIGYVLLFTSIIIYFPNLLPNSVDTILLKKIFLFMITGYGIYAIFHFPINGYLFKYSADINQKFISIGYIIVTITFALLSYFILSDWLKLNYQNLIIVVMSYIFSLLIIKTVVLLLNRTYLSDSA